MTINRIVLQGCAPVPLAHYLKALGVFRVIAQQLDSGARGWWRDDAFCLASKCDVDGLVEFFLERYEPTPFISPWNKGSGFFDVGDPGLDPIERSRASRFGPFRDAIKVARDAISFIEIAEAVAVERAITERSNAIKDKRKKKELRGSQQYKTELADAKRQIETLKARLIRDCRLKWRGPALEWLDAVLTLDSEGTARFPALLGSGGNDGNFEFANNAMQRIAELFDVESEWGKAKLSARGLLRSALFDDRVTGLRGGAIGQFFPGSAGGANTGAGPIGESYVNPWDFVFTLEGSVLFASASVRRFGTQALAHASAPFAVRSRAAGYGSASAAEGSTRGEQWMPLWGRPMAFSELRTLLAEGRAQVSGRTATTPVDLARAVARLGVARGLDGFVRYGYLKRNGDSNLAVPLGRVAVTERPRTRLLDDLEAWMERLRRAARGKNAPARLKAVERRVSDGVFDVLTLDDSPLHWQRLLCAMAEVESMQVAGTAASVGPIPPLRCDWLTAADDGSPVYRIAVALAGTHRVDEHARRISIRRNFLPLDKSGSRFATSANGLIRDPSVVASGREPVSDLLAIVERNVMEARRSNAGSAFPLRGRAGANARLDDLALFLEGRFDVSACLALACAFMALHPAAWSASPGARRPERRLIVPSNIEDGWIAIRLACNPWTAEDGTSMPADPAIVRLLASGDAARAFQVAHRALRSRGVRLRLSQIAADPMVARRWGAALAFPLSPKAFHALLERVGNPAQGVLA